MSYNAARRKQDLRRPVLPAKIKPTACFRTSATKTLIAKFLVARTKTLGSALAKEPAKGTSFPWNPF
jgi:hypothetical protein